MRNFFIPLRWRQLLGVSWLPSLHGLVLRIPRISEPWTFRLWEEGKHHVGALNTALSIVPLTEPSIAGGRLARIILLFHPLSNPALPPCS
ncbi:hypothetical protein SKAU_G00414560 [Synaphobranchus kaupii]|uniref:Uncharacterized protein n=1 Tax=Synaphobranchus kaupii TaxID=118154 RepID=A0A9Q1I9H6_SYNKA|nr:hypothetical protein SKAU_G00414560 [Synaphobranchus kaupii]